MTRVIDRAEMAAAFAEAAEVVKSGVPEERSGRVLPVGSVTVLRQRFELSREEFSDRYRIPLHTLQAWECGTAEPDAVAMAFLALIATDPAGAAKALVQGEAMAAADRLLRRVVSVKTMCARSDPIEDAMLLGNDHGQLNQLITDLNSA